MKKMAKVKGKKINKKIVDENTTLKEIFNKKGAEKILEKFNFPCLHCPMASQEIDFLKLGDVCRTYGIDLEEVLKELRKL